MKTCKDCGEEKPLTEFYKSKGYYAARCKPCHKKVSIAWAKANPERISARRKFTKRVQKYGITYEEYWARSAQQGGKCAICGGTTLRKGEHRDLDVDHCHSTGRIRGLLCSTCNKAIGMLKDDPAILRTAAQYLESAK